MLTPIDECDHPINHRELYSRHYIVCLNCGSMDTTTLSPNAIG